MASFIDRIRTFFKERKGSRLILILLTALLLELVAALQYTYTRNLLIKEEERITRMELTMESEIILHTLEEAELSMFENEWSVKESLAHPDSLFGVRCGRADDREQFECRGRLYRRPAGLLSGKRPAFRTLCPSGRRTDPGGPDCRPRPRLYAGALLPAGAPGGDGILERSV